MTQAASRRPCGKEILRALKDCSPATIDMLQQLIQPQIPKKNLRQALGILRHKGQVDMLIGGHQTFYYQLSQALPVRRQLADSLDCKPQDLEKSLLRRQDWFHNQYSQMWAGIIKTLFPQAQVVMEHDIGSNEIASDLLLTDKRDLDLLPDFLAILPKTETTDGVALAFEIERTRKSNSRIIRKLKKYLYETKVDGLIYICDSSRLSETIRTLYAEKLGTPSLRVSQYLDNFFLFSDAMSGGSQSLERFFNAKGEPTTLKSWCGQLLANERISRRDSYFN